MSVPLVGLGAVLEGAGGGGAGGKDAPAFGAGALDSRCGLCRQGVMLGVETDVFQALNSKGLKGAEPHVQGDIANLHALRFEFGEDGWREVQSGGRCGGGAGGAGSVHGLVARLVVGGIVAVNIGGKRHVADAVELGVEVGVGREAEGSLSKFTGCYDFGAEFGFFRLGAEDQGFTHGNLAAGLDEGGPGVWRLLAGEEDLDACGGVAGLALGPQADAGGVEARRQNAGIVEDQKVAGAQVVGQAGEAVVGEGSGFRGP